MSELIRREDAINAVEMFFEDAYIEDAEVHDLVYKINHIPAASPWHRVEDELPKPNRNVLWWCEIRGMGHIRMGQYEGATNHGIPEVSCCGPACKPLYWMPLPEPPKEDA